MKTVYVVDDDELMLELLTRALDRAGYSVRAHRSAVDAVTELHDVEPDLVISDINMPAMDGFEFAEVVAQLPRVVPVVLITAQPTHEQALRAQDIGIRGLVKKPVGNLSELIDLVRRIVPTTTCEDLDALRREFFVGLSHDLRTPVTALKLALDELDAGAPDIERLVHIGRRNAGRIARYIDTQLGLLELTASGRPVTRTAVTLEEALGGALPSRLNGAGGRLVWTDPARLQAVIGVLAACPAQEGRAVTVAAEVSGNDREVILKFENASFSPVKGRMDSCAGEARPASPWNPSAGDNWYSCEGACRRVVESLGGRLVVVDEEIRVCLPLKVGRAMTRTV